MIVDVVDEHNRTVGVAPRNVLLDRKLGFRTVHILLFDRANKLVLQKLPPKHPRNPNRLGSSVAGYLYNDETYARAAKRKLHEELGVIVRLRNIGQVKMTDSGSNKFVGVYLGKLTTSPDFNRDEVAELMYVDEQTLEKEIATSPDQFTPTFLRVYEHFARWRQSQ